SSGQKALALFRRSYFPCLQEQLIDLRVPRGHGSLRLTLPLTGADRAGLTRSRYARSKRIASWQQSTLFLGRCRPFSIVEVHVEVGSPVLSKSGEVGVAVAGEVADGETRGIDWVIVQARPTLHAGASTCMPSRHVIAPRVGFKATVRWHCPTRIGRRPSRV